MSPLALADLLWTLARVRWTLRRGGLHAALQRFPGTAAGADAAPSDLAMALRAQHWLRRFGRLLPTSACLDQALALRAFLAARGIAATLKIGARRDVLSATQTPVVAAHAWVCINRQPIGEPIDIAERYSAFPGDL